MSADIKIFTNEVEDLAKQQIERFASLPAFANAKIRIMPDTHAGKGCVIGFTANIVDKVMPNVVGVDIGCGMHVVALGNINIDYKKLDDFIKNNIPAGNSVRQTPVNRTIHSWCIDKLAVKDKLLNKPRLEQSMGTLGGGNHFISIEEDESGCKYLIIHTGSRGLGKQVADIYQKMAADHCSDPDYTEELISTLKKCGLYKHISSLVKEYKNREIDNIADPDAAYIEGEDMENYIEDMHICEYWAYENRKQIAKEIVGYLGIDYRDIMLKHEILKLSTIISTIRISSVRVQSPRIRTSCSSYLSIWRTVLSSALERVMQIGISQHLTVPVDACLVTQPASSLIWATL